MFLLNNCQNQHFILVLLNSTSSAAAFISTAVYSFNRLFLHHLKAEFVFNNSVIKGLTNINSEDILSAVYWHWKLCAKQHNKTTVRTTARQEQQQNKSNSVVKIFKKQRQQMFWKSGVHSILYLTLQGIVFFYLGLQGIIFFYSSFYHSTLSVLTVLLLYNIIKLQLWF